MGGTHENSSVYGGVLQRTGQVGVSHSRCAAHAFITRHIFSSHVPNLKADEI